MSFEVLHANKKSWDKVADRFYGRNPLPEYGPFAPSEEELYLFGDVKGAKILEIGCGSGHSLQYMDQKNAGELWGLDLSKKQIKAANKLLKNSNSTINLFESPMEEDPGLPDNYFDIVFSIFALGWTTNLHKTLSNVNKYLKPGGTFIFSWEHPLFNRVSSKEDSLIFNKPYHEEGPYTHEAWTDPAIMQQYRLSTYVNSLINHGFKINRIVEDVRLSEDDIKKHSNSWYLYEKAKFLPTTLIIKSQKC
ncbi:class I SAM-dependent methyltransferase [Lentibacillus sediminis]|uniref:class I SAM-dependent methyltransferase n=1 Tax=Lentibacillus sediminis TaxID=1940529 RepID=UPI000C1BC061|nr:class I SAM-dependent methyltransferase [Lentibacillus sediminis]